MKKNKIRKYLKKVCRWVNSKNRINTYRELSYHFESIIEKDLASGKTVDQSEIEILSAQPPAFILGYKLKKAQQGFLRRNILQMSTSLIVIFSLLTAYKCIQKTEELVAKSIYNYKNIVSDEQKNFSFIADLKFIDQNKGFSFFETSYNQDATEFIDDMTKYLSTKHDEFRQLMNLTRSSKQDDFNLLISKISQIDFSRILNAKKYDHMVGDAFLRRKEYINLSQLNNLEKIGFFSKAQGLPVELVDYLILYLLHECHLGKCNTALDTISHYSRLIYSTQDIYNMTLAFSLLNRSHLVANKFGSSHLKISDAVLDAMKRTTFAWPMVYYNILLNKRIDSRLEPYLNQKYGFCSAIVDRPLGYYNSIADFLTEDRWPLEPQFKSEIAFEKDFILSKLNECRLNYLAPALINNPTQQIFISHFDNLWMWNAFQDHDSNYQAQSFELLDKLSGEFKETLKASVITKINLAAIPYIRTFVGVYTLSIGNPTLWGKYQQHTEK